MLPYRKLREENGALLYEHAIERDPDHTGLVSIDLTTGEAAALDHLDRPSYMHCAAKLRLGLEKQFKNDSLKDSGWIIWG